jgi:hypothetical protein
MNPSALPSCNEVPIVPQATIERLSSIGPWSLRRDNSTGYSVITSPASGLWSRRETISSGGAGVVGSPPGATEVVAVNPFSEAFGKAIDQANIVERGEGACFDNAAKVWRPSVASSSTAVGGDMGDASTVESVLDAKIEALRATVDGKEVEADFQRSLGSKAVVGDAEGEWRRLRREKTPITSRANTDSNNHAAARATGAIDFHHSISWRLPTAQQAAASLNTQDIDRSRFENVDTFRSCTLCRIHSRLAQCAIWIIFATALLSWAGAMLLTQLLSEELGAMAHALHRNDNTKLAIALLATPVLCFWSVLVVAALLVMALRSKERDVSKRRLRSGWRLIGWWSGVLVGGLVVYAVCAGLVYHFTKDNVAKSNGLVLSL